MGFLDSLFGPKLFPSHDKPEVNRLVNELINIGIKEDYLSEHPGGGYNLQWAWASGMLAGRCCAQSLRAGGGNE